VGRRPVLGQVSRQPALDVILCKSITFACVHLRGNKSQLGLDSKVVRKVGEIDPLVAILRGKWAKNTKGAIAGQNNRKGAKMLNS